MVCIHKTVVTIPGIDSWVQPRLNLGEPSKQVIQVNLIPAAALSSLAVFFKKTNKKPGFNWACWVCCQSNKTQRAGFTGF